MMGTPRRAGRHRSNAITSPSQHPRWHLAGQLAILLLTIAAPVVSTPISYFPLNSQLPPVARVSEPYSFVFSPLTFSSDTEMSYALAEGSPSWLSLDSKSRELSGTPDEASIPPGETLVGVVIALVASDEGGSTAVNATLVVSRNSGPTVRIPLKDQIENFGPYSAPASVLLHPSSEFSFEFDPNTFDVGTPGHGDGQGKTQDVKIEDDKSMSGPGLPLNYYAVSGDNAPLPSWIEFDAGKLAFSGKTPTSESLVQPPQMFDFKLVASDVVGFSSTSIDFSIVVGLHELTIENSIIELNATRGKPIEYTDLPNVIKLDKQPLKPENVSSITVDGLPKWLSFDDESWKVSGTPDEGAQPTNVTIAVVDKFFDTLNVTLAVKFHTAIFLSDLPSLNISAGDDFSLDLKRFLFAPLDTQVTTETQPNDFWIRFDDSSKVLSGTAPKPLPADFANEIRIPFNATQRRTKDKEVKYLNIHVATSTEHRPEGPEGPEDPEDPEESPDANSKADDSRRDLYWLLVLPVLAGAVAFILFIFRMRRRRHPTRLDFSEVSRPIPGSFVANGYTGASFGDIRRMMDPGPQASSIRPSAYALGAQSNYKKSQTTSNSATEVDHIIPHAITTYSGPVRSEIHSVTTTKGRKSWLSGRQARASPTSTDEISLLSDTSLGETIIIPQDDPFPKPRRPEESAQGKKPTLEVPITTEPLSIQPTPELAYMIAGGKYDYVSDDEKPPVVGYPGRRRSGYQQNKSPSPRGVQHRLSKNWKRGSVSRIKDLKRQSHFSASTDVTTRTSILTSGVAEEATTASTNIVAKPTVVHIPSRPGEARQLSRRTNDSITFFGGGSLRGSQRNFRLTKDTTRSSVYPVEQSLGPSIAASEQGGVRDGDTTWDHPVTNSLGIAYGDLIHPERATRGSFVGPNQSRIGVAQSENWKPHSAAKYLKSPSRWPAPDVFVGLGGTPDVFRNQSEPPQPAPLRQMTTKSKPPATPTDKGKKRASFRRKSSRGSSFVSSPSKTPLSHTRSKTRTSREERVRLSRIREQKALDEFRAMMASATPSPRGERVASKPRQLPETPSRASKVPPTGRLNEPRGLKSTLSRRSVKTMQSAKSVRSAWADDDDDWEDVPPPESVVGGWEAEASDGSFPVYI